MERFDHVAELIEHAERLAPRTVGVMRGEERDRLVSPVVHASWRRVLGVELKHRQQLHRRDAEVHEVRDLLDQPGVGASLPGRDARARVAREAAHVKLVDQRLGERPIERRIALPVVGAGIGDDTLHGGRGVAARPAGGLAIVGVRDGHGEPIRIEEHLVAIEPQATFRCEWPLGPVGVHLAGLQVRHEDVPVVVAAVPHRVERDDPCRLFGIPVSEQQQLDERGALREYAEVDPARTDRGAQRCARAGFDD